MQTEKSVPEGKRIMPETRFTEFPALSVDPRVGISRSHQRPMFGLNIFYFLNKYDNISMHCNQQVTGSERKQEYLYSSSPEHIKFVKFTGRILKETNV